MALRKKKTTTSSSSTSEASRIIQLFRSCVAEHACRPLTVAHCVTALCDELESADTTTTHEHARKPDPVEAPGATAT